MPLSDDGFDSELEQHGLWADPPLEGSSRWSVGRVLSLLGLFAMIGFWVWAFSPLAPRGHPDELDDPAFAAFAEVRCSAAVERIAEDVPLASAAVNAAARGEQIQASTDILTLMLADLVAAAPEAGSSDGQLVALWLGDWDTYLQDRYAYAADFLAGIDQAFVVTAVNRDQV
ncbi:MAG: hypothetical protein ACC660_03515, partial [Acidimicrobiales bacterium]